jgi:hypothetical protein
LDPPRKAVPREIGNFGLRGSVSFRLAGTIAVNVTQVMVSSKSIETGAQFKLLSAAAFSIAAHSCKVSQCAIGQLVCPIFCASEELV